MLSSSPCWGATPSLCVTHARFSVSCLVLVLYVTFCPHVPALSITVLSVSYQMRGCPWSVGSTKLLELAPLYSALPLQGLPLDFVFNPLYHCSQCSCPVCANSVAVGTVQRPLVTCWGSVARLLCGLVDLVDLARRGPHCTLKAAAAAAEHLRFWRRWPGCPSRGMVLAVSMSICRWGHLGSM